jgi:4-amino-4-deoxy-L-arabinose transferase-like glycosyltransferase
MRKIAFWSLLILFIILRLYGITNPLSEQASWRQADTSAMARNLLQNFSFLPQLDYDGPGPNTSELEFPLLPLVVSLFWRLFGVADWSARLCALGFSILSFIFLWRFAEHTLDRRAAFFACLVYTIIPFNIFYNRAVMPEPVLLACSLMALDAFVQYLDRGGKCRWAFATVSLGMAVLAKPNFLFLGLVFLALLVQRKGWQGCLDGKLWLMAVAALLPTFLYYQWAGQQANQLFLSGLLEKRMLPSILETATSFAFWSFLPVRLAERICSWPGLVLYLLFSLLALFRARVRFLFFWLLGCLLLFIFVSLPVQYEHDYYHLLIVPGFSLCLGWGFAEVMRFHIGHLRLKRLTVGLALLLVTEIALAGLVGVGHFWQVDPSPIRMGQLIQEVVGPGELIVIDQFNPIAFYYSERKAWRVSPGSITPTLVALRKSEGATCLVLQNLEDRVRFPSLDTPGMVWLDGVDGKLIQLK